MARPLRPLPTADVARLLARHDRAVASGEAVSQDDVRALVKHFLAELSARAPGKSVEIRIPPYAAAQAIAGARHTRGTPPAVVEMDGLTWIALARGDVAFATALKSGHVRASGERSDLSAHLPLL